MLEIALFIVIFIVGFWFGWTLALMRNVIRVLDRIDESVKRIYPESDQ